MFIFLDGIDDVVMFVVRIAMQDRQVERRSERVWRSRKGKVTYKLGHLDSPSEFTCLRATKSESPLHKTLRHQEPTCNLQDFHNAAAKTSLADFPDGISFTSSRIQLQDNIFNLSSFVS